MVSKIKKRSKPSVGELKDRLSSLPDEILLAILSRLSLKEAATIGVVSRRCKQLWHCYPNLSFDDPSLNSWLGKKNSRWNIRRERPTVIKRINAIVKQHTGPAIDEFKVNIDFIYKHHAHHIDKWVEFAFEKNVKSLHLRLEPTYQYSRKSYTLLLPPQNRNRNLSNLKSLCLAYVKVCDQLIQCFPSCFPLLEDLRLRCADNLRNIRNCSPYLHLKHLEVADCESLEVIDLSVPQLLSINYKGQPVELRLRNASSLSAVSVSSWSKNASSLSVVSVSSSSPRYQIAYAFDSILTHYAQQLEFLQLKLVLQKQICMDSCPCLLLLPNLKLLSLYVDTESDSTLAGWAPLIAASPLLQKLTLKFEIEIIDILGELGRNSRREKAKFDSHPLECLKTLEIVGFKGCCVDLEFAMYVVENAIVLEEVVIIPSNLPSYLSRQKCNLDKMVEEGVLQLKGKLPKTAKLTLVRPSLRRKC